MSEHHYELQAEETAYLNANYSSWGFLSADGLCGVVIHNFPVPPGYTPESSDMMVVIPQGYPAAALDMFYFCPELAKTNGGSIGALAMEQYFGRAWQRWSRHYQWIPGQDDIVRHIEFVKNTLKKESGQ